MVVVGQQREPKRACCFRARSEESEPRVSIDGRHGLRPAADGRIARLRRIPACGQRRPRLGEERLGRRRAGGLVGDRPQLTHLLLGKGQPALELRVELLFALEIHGDVQQRAGGGHHHPLGAQRLDGTSDDELGAVEIGPPDVPAVDDASGEPA